MAGRFYRIDLEGGGTVTAHMRFRGRAPLACVAPDFSNPKERCGRMAVALCDERVGRAGTCSVPMCERHRQAIGPNRDLCPRHAVARLPLGDA